MHEVGNQEGQFGGVLKYSRHFCGTAPVEIQVSVLVCPNLKPFWWKAARIVNDVVIGR